MSSVHTKRKNSTTEVEIEMDSKGSGIGPQLSVKNKISDLHTAAAKGNLSELKQILDGLSVSNKESQLTTGDDDKGRKPLHFAVTYWNENVGLQMTEFILNVAEGIPKPPKELSFLELLVSITDKGDETPLHLAVRFCKSDVVNFIFKKLPSVSLNWRTKYGKTVLDLIYECLPNVIIPRLDNAINFKPIMASSASGIPKLIKTCVELDFGPIVGHGLPDSSSIFRVLKNSKVKYGTVLKHPAVQLFLFVKWNRMKRVFQCSFWLHVLWSLLCGGYLFYMFIDTCPFKNRITSDIPEKSMKITPSDNEHNHTLPNDISCDVGNSWTTIYIFIILVLCSSSLMLVKELCEMFSITSAKRIKLDQNQNINKRQKRTAAKITNPDQDENIENKQSGTNPVQEKRSQWKKELMIFFKWTLPNYFTRMENIGQILLIIFMQISTWPILLNQSSSSSTLEIQDWQYQIAAISMLLPWALLLGQLGKFGLSGVYIEMYKRVCKGFLIFTFALICILVGFALSFKILMPYNHSFKSATSSMTKLFVMMIGEMDYEGLFSEENNGGVLEFPMLAKLIFVCFIGTVTITLFNLLIGINITDIQTLREDAEINELAATLERIHSMEEFLFKCNPLFAGALNKYISMATKASSKDTEERKGAVTVYFEDIRHGMVSLTKRKREELIREIKKIAYENKSKRH